MYRQTSSKRHTKPKKLKCFSSRLAVVFAQSIEARCQVKNKDVFGAASTCYAPTTSEWSTSLFLRCDLYHRFDGICKYIIIKHFRSYHPETLPVFFQIDIIYFIWCTYVFAHWITGNEKVLHFLYINFVFHIRLQNEFCKISDCCIQDFSRTSGFQCSRILTLYMLNFSEGT